MNINIIISLITALGASGIIQIILKRMEIGESRRTSADETNRRLTALEEQVTEVIPKQIADLRAMYREQVEEIKEENAMNHAIEARVRILQFSDEIMNREKHSQEMFDQILGDMDTYQRYCDTHPRFENNKTVLASKRIRDVYARCLEQKDFL